jgi:ABC-type Fe3+-hydroxamate transport system substrate-binding protein
MSGTPAEIPTRREYVKGSGALVGGGLLAGCTSDGSNASAGESKNGTTADADSYSVTMAPMGTVEFEDVPKSVFTIFPQYADMAVALGHGDAVNSVYVPEMSGKTMNTYYDRLEGVSFEWKGLPDPLKNGLNRELFYKLDSDVHLVDPAYISTQNGWSQSDIEDIQNNIGPWFGNFYSGTHDKPPEGYRDGYRYYGLWEMFEKIAEIFQEQERARALTEIHANVLSTIEENLPPKNERPTAVRVTYNDGSFYTYHLNKPGYWLADTRPLDATDAFAEQDWANLWGTVDFETMLDADPDVILHLWGISPGYHLDEIRKQIESQPAGRQLSAIQNNRFYAAGMRYQGPIMNLFQLEMTAKQLYPEQFGEWPGYVTGEPYPEIPADERLFDRRKLADVIGGTF